MKLAVGCPHGGCYNVKTGEPCPLKTDCPLTTATKGIFNICGLCKKPDPDKTAKWMGGGIYWPGEKRPDHHLVHTMCEDDECSRAQNALRDDQIATFLGEI